MRKRASTMPTDVYVNVRCVTCDQVKGRAHLEVELELGVSVEPRSVDVWVQRATCQEEVGRAW